SGWRRLLLKLGALTRPSLPRRRPFDKLVPTRELTAVLRPLMPILDVTLRRARRRCVHLRLIRPLQLRPGSLAAGNQTRSSRLKAFERRDYPNEPALIAMEQERPGRVGRRLAAIVAADVAGYSRLMGLDEVGTARTLREHRKVTDALVE